MDAVEQELLDAIARDPEDPAPYLVYADWLQGKGSPRGELMTLQNATEDRPGDHRIADAALAHVRAHATYYLGALAPYVDDTSYLRLGWRCGFIASAELLWHLGWPDERKRKKGLPPKTVLATLLQLDAARFLTRLVVEPTHEVDARFIGQALARHPPRTLRELWIGPREPYSSSRDCDLGELAFGDLPHLRELGVHGDPRSLGKLELPHLRSATIMLAADARHASRVLDEVAAAHWPDLERLHVWSASVNDMAGALRRDDLVVLGELGVINCAEADPMCRAIARSPLAPQLFRLSLTKGTLTDAGVAILAEQRDRLASLAMIDVSETSVTAHGIARLRTFVPEVVARDLRIGPPRIAILPHTRHPGD